MKLKRGGLILGLLSLAVIAAISNHAMNFALQRNESAKGAVEAVLKDDGFIVRFCDGAKLLPRRMVSVDSGGDRPAYKKITLRVNGCNEKAGLVEVFAYEGNDDQIRYEVRYP